MAKVVTETVRFSYANVWKPKSINDSEPKYSVCLLIPKEDKKTVELIKKAVEDATKEGTEKWGSKFATGANFKLPVRDGDAEKPDDEAYKNCYFVNANSFEAPGIVDNKLQPIIDTTEFYSGCYGRASVNFYPFNIGANKGIACGLNNLQKLADGEPFGGRSKPEDDFDADELL